MSGWRTLLMMLVALINIVLGIDNLLSGNEGWGWFGIVGGIVLGVIVLAEYRRRAP